MPETFDPNHLTIKLRYRDTIFDFSLVGKDHTTKFLSDSGLDSGNHHDLVGRVIRILGKANDLGDEEIIVGPIYGIRPQQQEVRH